MKGWEDPVVDGELLAPSASVLNPSFTVAAGSWVWISGERWGKGMSRWSFQKFLPVSPRVLELELLNPVGFSAADWLCRLLLFCLYLLCKTLLDDSTVSKLEGRCSRHDHTHHSPLTTHNITNPPSPPSHLHLPPAGPANKENINIRQPTFLVPGCKYQVLHSVTVWSRLAPPLHSVSWRKNFINWRW